MPSVQRRQRVKKDDAKARRAAVVSAEPKRAWVVGGALEAWWGIALALREQGIDIKPVGADADLAALAIEVERAVGVIVVDLKDNIERGIGAVSACRSASKRALIVAAAEDPSLELVQRLRSLDVTYLAKHPIDATKMRDLLSEAFGQAEKQHAQKESKKKILVIDDDVDFSSSIAALLKGQGYTVCCASTGSAGVDLAVSEKPDLIVLDVMMENMWAGYEVNQTLKFQRGYEGVRRTPIVMVSSIREHPTERFARSEDPSKVCPDVYLTKPLEIPQFLETVRQLLAGTTPTQTTK
jgi:CheY-like chemotaxis protein